MLAVLIVDLPVLGSAGALAVVVLAFAFLGAEALPGSSGCE